MNSPGWIITLIGSAVFIAVMWVVKEGAKAAITEYGAWIGFAGAALGIALGYWIDSRKKPPTAR